MQLDAEPPQTLGTHRAQRSSVFDTHLPSATATVHTVAVILLIKCCSTNPSLHPHNTDDPAVLLMHKERCHTPLTACCIHYHAGGHALGTHTHAHVRQCKHSKCAHLRPPRGYTCTPLNDHSRESRYSSRVN